MGLPPSSTMVSSLLAASAPGREVSRLWLRRSSVSWRQWMRALPRSESWLWAMDSFRRALQLWRAVPRLAMRLPLSTSVFSAVAAPKPALRTHPSSAVPGVQALQQRSAPDWSLVKFEQAHTFNGHDGIVAGDQSGQRREAWHAQFSRELVLGDIQHLQYERISTYNHPLPVSIVFSFSACGRDFATGLVLTSVGITALWVELGAWA